MATTGVLVSGRRRHRVTAASLGRFAQVARERAAEAEILAQVGDVLGEDMVVHERHVGAADLPPLGRDAIVDLLRVGGQRAQDIGEARHGLSAL